MRSFATPGSIRAAHTRKPAATPRWTEKRGVNGSSGTIVPQFRTIRPVAKPYSMPSPERRVGQRRGDPNKTPTLPDARYHHKPPAELGCPPWAHLKGTLHDAGMNDLSNSGQMPARSCVLHPMIL